MQKSIYDLNIEKILFIDIETVPEVFNHGELDDHTKHLWDLKSKYFQNEELSAADVYSRAGIYAEFAKVVCITTGFIRIQDSVKHYRSKSISGHNEVVLLSEFADLLNEKFSYENYVLCAHNGKEFDYPFLSRRMMINGVKLPEMLDISGKKPWEVNHLDTLEMWKFGDYKHYTSLQLLAHAFGIPTPKDDISGADVGRVYWEEKNLERIVAYCEKDVLTVAQLFLKMRGEQSIKPEYIINT